MMQDGRAASFSVLRHTLRAVPYDNEGDLRHRMGRAAPLHVPSRPGQLHRPPVPSSCCEIVFKQQANYLHLTRGALRRGRHMYGAWRAWRLAADLTLTLQRLQRLSAHTVAVAAAVVVPDWTLPISTQPEILTFPHANGERIVKRHLPAGFEFDSPESTVQPTDSFPTQKAAHSATRKLLGARSEPRRPPRAHGVIAPTLVEEHSSSSNPNVPSFKPRGNILPAPPSTEFRPRSSPRRGDTDDASPADELHDPSARREERESR
ncbi:hypothetical protein CKAH01_01825 [Colletotrichum kahawae]|uniref:Uncharacterized protein n=1 Tax=Colletotrichum kahawae TaxID=34407 RepID=A0AAD9Y449_COLKA|nr:hypothetical protein CKAH01_01825 [Colletotrichum kahawae]